MHINFSLEMSKVRYQLESLDLDREVCYFKKYITWGVDMIFLAKDREQWWSLMNSHSKRGRNLLSIYASQEELYVVERVNWSGIFWYGC